ncbi:MAG: MinD/ParA family protein [Candidatus Riflebacteria bacterium]|nr:MinD/ParA family protein [Candidatus Riflebacteria bacterium]
MAESTLETIESIVETARREIKPYVAERLQSRTPRLPGAKIAQTITVTSGKGGVGKSSLTANLAISLAMSGKKVIVLDADLGLANVDVIFGVRPEYSLLDVISGERKIDEIMVEGPHGIQIIAGGSGVAELANLDSENASQLFQQLTFLEDKADYLLIDTGAGLNRTVLSFCQAADKIIVVTTTEPTALVDAFGVIKVIVRREKKANLSVLVNRVESKEEGEEIYCRLAYVAREYLDGYELSFMGSVPQDKNMHLAIRKQQPLLLLFPDSPAAKALQRLSKAELSGVADEFDSEEHAGFFTRLANIFKGGAA